MEEHGKVVIVLEEYRVKKNISKNKIVENAKVQRTQLQNYLLNKVSRVDLDVLARICNYLDCEISDVLKFEKPAKDKNRMIKESAEN